MPLFILIVIPRSSAAVGTSYGQCNLSSLRHEIPHSSAEGSFIEGEGFFMLLKGGRYLKKLFFECKTRREKFKDTVDLYNNNQFAIKLEVLV